MKITALETLRLGEFANLLWVRLHTDEGLTGLGETFMGAAAVEAYLHETVAPKLIGRDPGRIEAINGALAEVSARIKMGQTSVVRAVAKAGDKFYVAQKECKVTVGGCGG